MLAHKSMKTFSKVDNFRNTLEDLSCVRYSNRDLVRERYPMWLIIQAC